MKVDDIKVLAQRQAGAGVVDPLFVERWSPRAFSEQLVPEALLQQVFEAARWAPSCFNEQPWRFVYATRDDERFGDFVNLLMEANQAWASKAAVLVIVLSRNTYENNDTPAMTNSFDAGAAWMSLALQARMLGLHTHGMRGFDKDAAREALQVSATFDVEAMIAIGYGGDVA